MPIHRSLRLPLLLLAGYPAVARAQGDPLVAARVAMLHYDAAAARPALAAALARNPGSYEANWRMAVTLMNLGSLVSDPKASARRDSLYSQSESYARRAVAAKPDGAEGHFALAAALGRTALTRGTRERIQLATEIRAEALRAVALDPRHDGAWHVLGRWNAEVERLSGFDRFMARHFLGGAVLGSASWENAERYLRLAVQYAPTRIYHRLDLAEVLVDRHEWTAARVELEAIAALPPVEPLDRDYKAQADRLEARVMAKLGQ